MKLSTIITAAGVGVALLTPTIPGCGMIASAILKIGAIVCADLAAKAVERAIDPAAPKGSALRTAGDAVAETVIVGSAIFVAAYTTVPGWACALFALLASGSLTASYEEEFTELSASMGKSEKEVRYT